VLCVQEASPNEIQLMPLVIRIPQEEKEGLLEREREGDERACVD
jgi:hypothetical protein